MRYACPICGNTRDNRVWTAREMMIGMRETFDYVECAECLSLHRAGPTPDMARFYPVDYFAHGRPHHVSPLRRQLWRAQARRAMGRWWGPVGALLVWRYGPPRFLDWMRHADVPRDAAVLDVGCGDGYLLRRLRAAGWRRLTGIDLFLDADVEHPDGIVLRKRALEDMTGSFDFIMLHHSFEHMPDPFDAARHIRRLLAPDGRALVRIPVADSDAWRTYRADWVHLDAPRHVVIPSVEGMCRVAHAAGLAIDRVTYDSTGVQFWGSEQYRRNIALADARRVRADGCLCSREERARCDERARKLNATGGADQACFYLRRPVGP